MIKLSSGGTDAEQRMNLTHATNQSINKKHTMKNTKPIKQNTASPFENRDLNQQLRFPTISWSSIAAFTFSNRDKTSKEAKEEWYQSYVLGNRIDERILPGQILAGKKIGEALAEDPTYLPEVPRPEVYEFTVPKTKFFDFYITGHMDGFSPSKNELLEYKTSQSETYWNKDSVKKHGQLDFYCLLLLHKYKIKPEDVHIRLVYIPVKPLGDFTVVRSEKPIQIFETYRTTLEIAKFGVYIQDIYTQMQLFVKQKELSTESNLTPHARSV